VDSSHKQKLEFAMVLAIVLSLFCVLGSVACYRRARHHYAIWTGLNVFAKVIVVLRADTGLLSGVF
jgi:hypothetical protein